MRITASAHWLNEYSLAFKRLYYIILLVRDVLISCMSNMIRSKTVTILEQNILVVGREWEERREGKLWLVYKISF